MRELFYSNNSKLLEYAVRNGDAYCRTMNLTCKPAISAWRDKLQVKLNCNVAASLTKIEQSVI